MLNNETINLFAQLYNLTAIELVEVAKELAQKNITVNTIAPGYIETDMTKKIWWSVHKEDHAICERLQEGRASPASEAGGLLSPYWEKGVQKFQKLIIQATMKSSKIMKGKKNV